MMMRRKDELLAKNPEGMIKVWPSEPEKMECDTQLEKLHTVRRYLES